jgi:pilus assembly protein CpaB
MRRLLLPLCALLLAGAATVAARSWLDGRRAQPVAGAAPEAPAVPRKAVLVAAADLPAGTLLQPGGVRWQEWPDVAIPQSYLLQDGSSEADYVGAVLRRPAASGEPLARGNIVRPGDRGFLAAVLEPGMRAVSVPVDDASSNAGLILPGDRVDLVLTQIIPGAEGEPPRRVGETVLTDARIIAMGRRLDQDAGEAGAGQIRTATLEVTPAGAERVALVAELGKLSLSLRSLAAGEHQPAAPPVSPGITWDSEVSPVLRPENQPRTGLLLLHGSKAETVSVRQGTGGS